MPQKVVDEYGAVAVENHLNMFVPLTARPKVSLKMLAGFLSTTVADRVIRCINGSVALSASELAAMPLPTIDDLTTAFSARDPESAIRRVYGIVDDPAENSSSQPNS
jgi:adenine-specific DNA-methyltransferase